MPSTRRTFLRTVAAGLAAGGMVTPAVSDDHVQTAQSTAIPAGGTPVPAEPLRLAAGPHLVLDDSLFARREGVTLKAQACRKLDRPVLTGEKPWENGRVYVYGSVLDDPATGGLRMWYMSRVEGGPKHDPLLTRSPGGRDLTLYATSADGIAWTRPNLGLYEFDGSRDNNIVFDLHSPSVAFDPADPAPARRYKMLGFGRGEKGSGYCAATSPDGLHWQAAPGNPILPKADTITLAHDPATGEFLALHKNHAKHRGYGRRLVYVSSSRDFRTWTPPAQALAPDVEDDAWAKDPGQRMDFYNLSAFRRGRLWVGLVTAFRVRQRLGKTALGQSPDDGPIDVQLVTSRDGLRWQRCSDRTPVIPNGPHPYDAGCILGISNMPVYRGGEMWMYYTAITTTHGGALPEKQLTIARAAWRQDGLAALETAAGQGGAEGIVETVPLAVPAGPARTGQASAGQAGGAPLIVNADASAGRLRVEVLDADGRALAGYAAADCRAIAADGVALAVTWATHDRLPAAQTIRLRFLLQGAKLFSLTLGGEK